MYQVNLAGFTNSISLLDITYDRLLVAGSWDYRFSCGRNGFHQGSGRTIVGGRLCRIVAVIGWETVVARFLNGDVVASALQLRCTI